MTSPETPQFSDPVDRLNAEGRESILEDARRMRQNIIGSAFEATQEFLLIDAIKLRNSNEAASTASKHTFFTGRQYIFALPVSQDVITVETLLFIPNQELGQTGKHKLMTYIPIPSDFSVDKYDEISALPRPDFVIFERIDERGESQHWALNEERCYPIELRKSAEEIIPEFDAEELAREMSKRVDSGMKILSDFYEDMINMKVVPQIEFPAT